MVVTSDDLMWVCKILGIDPDQTDEVRITAGTVYWKGQDGWHIIEVIDPSLEKATMVVTT